MSWTTGEFTGDGTVDINDLTIVLRTTTRPWARSPVPNCPPCPNRRACRRGRPACWPVGQIARRKRTKKATAFPFFSKETD